MRITTIQSNDCEDVLLADLNDRFVMMCRRVGISLTLARAALCAQSSHNDKEAAVLAWRTTLPAHEQVAVDTALQAPGLARVRKEQDRRELAERCRVEARLRRSVAQ